MTRDKLVDRKKELLNAKENMVSNLNVIVGMINEVEHWIKSFDPADPNVEVPDGSQDTK
jgi:hypothetical protein